MLAIIRLFLYSKLQQYDYIVASMAHSVPFISPPPPAAAAATSARWKLWRCYHHRTPPRGPKERLAFWQEKNTFFDVAKRSTRKQLEKK